MEFNEYINSLNVGQMNALRHALERNDLVIVGMSGSGKTFLLMAIASTLRKLGLKVVMTAPTGKAAESIGGYTLHKVLNIRGDDRGISPTDCRPIDHSRTSMLKGVDCVILDEMSMLPIDYMDALLNTVVSINKRRTENRLQVIIAGDVRQLPPYVDTPIRDYLEFRYIRNIKSGYFFDSALYADYGFKRMELTEVVRQADDPEFAKALNALYLGKRSDEAHKAVDWINEHSSKDAFDTEEAVWIYGRRDQVRDRNLNVLSGLPGESRKYSVDFGDVDRDDVSMGHGGGEIELKVGAKVMITRNDHSSSDGTMTYVNGTIAQVSAMDDTGVSVTLKSGTVISFSSSSPMPLILAYALTVHKAQGATFDYANVDPEKCHDFPGQLYTALSRVRTAASLHLLSPLKTEYLDHPIVEEALKFLQNANDDTKTLAKGKGRPKKGGEAVKVVSIPNPLSPKSEDGMAVLLAKLRERSRESPEALPVVSSVLSSIPSEADKIKQIVNYMPPDVIPKPGKGQQVPGGTRKQGVPKSWVTPVRSVMRAIKDDASVLPLVEAALKYTLEHLNDMASKLKTAGLLQ